MAMAAVMSSAWRIVHSASLAAAWAGEPSGTLLSWCTALRARVNTLLPSDMTRRELLRHSAGARALPIFLRALVIAVRSSGAAPGGGEARRAASSRFALRSLGAGRANLARYVSSSAPATISRARGPSSVHRWNA